MKGMKALLCMLSCCVLAPAAWAEPSAAGVEPAGPVAAKATVLLDTSADWAGVRLPAYPASQARILVVRGRVAPGEIAPMHQHPVIGTYYILKGNLTVRTQSGATLHASAGNAYAEVTNQWHWGKNEGTEDVELVFFYAGAEGVDNVIPKN